MLSKGALTDFLLKFISQTDLVSEKTYFFLRAIVQIVILVDTAGNFHKN